MRGNSTEAGQAGIALIPAIWLTIVVLGVVSTGAMILRAHRDSNELAFARFGQAVQTARSGLVEARSWLRRQTGQPVTAFEPRLAPAADPPVLDTIDPAIGIVRESRINAQTWARYEVWKRWDTDPVPSRRAQRQQLQCEDISLLRGAGAPGAVWRLRCVGYVYERVDPNKAFNESPNHVVAREVIQVECERLMLRLPGTGAVNVSDGNNCHVNTMGRILGGATAAGIYYPAGSGKPTTGPAHDNRVTGTPALATATEYDDSYEAVFSMPLDELKAMASMVLADVADCPNPVPDGSILVIEQNSIHFDAAHPLTGSGLVVCIGNVNIDPGSNSNFSGLLYVDGGLIVRDPCEIRGAVIVTGNLNIQGSGDYSTIAYDGDVLDALRSRFGSYNISSSFLRVLDRDR